MTSEPYDGPEPPRTKAFSGQRGELLTKALIVVLILGTLLSLPLRPLWVDEIYQLEATRDQSFTAMLHSSMVAPGGMPLAYTAQQAWLAIAGFSTVQARVPAALFGLGSVWAMAWLARFLGISSILVSILGLITPLLFRYSTEARPYSQGLFFSVLSTALFLQWWRHGSNRNLLAYAFCLVAAVYSQPFSLFVALSHCVYTALEDRKRLPRLLGASIIPAALYVPWFLLSRHALAHEAWPHLMFFSWRQISPLMLLREISGGGYLCSVLLFIAAAFARRRPERRLLLCWTLLPATLAICADAAFNYFFAIRQLIFILPPLLILASSGISVLWERRRKLAIVLALGYVAGALVKDVRWQMDHRENWEKAAVYLSAHLNGPSECVTFEPNRDAPSYYFFQPSLKAKTCKAAEQPRLIAISPYADGKQRKAEATSSKNVGNTLIVEPRIPDRHS